MLVSDRGFPFVLVEKRYYFAPGKRPGCHKGKVFISVLPFGLKVYTSDKREHFLFPPPHPTRIFNLAFLLQHLLRIVRVEDVWLILFARYPRDFNV